MQNKIKHSKIRNSGLLFEFLLRQITLDVLNKNTTSKAVEMIKENFNETTELGKELALYNILLSKKFSDDKRAEFFINEVLQQRQKLNNSKLRRERYNLIKSCKESYDTSKLFLVKQNDNEIQYVIGEQNKIYPLMSGHNTICAATAVLECGVVSMNEPITKFIMEAPAGPIEITAQCENGKAKSIALKNAPSFVEYLDIVVDVPHGNIGKVKLDIAYGGMWYAVVDLSQFDNVKHLNMTLDTNNGANLAKYGEMIKVACREQFPVDHPTEDYPGVDILVFRGKASEDSGAHSRNTVVMSNCELDWNKPETWTAMLDRSPCGTGTCAVMAVMHARGELKVGEQFIHESIVGSKFIGTILEEQLLEGGNGKIAIIPEIKGSACVTQYSEIVIDPEDPFPTGYRVADIW